ncbi:MAG: helix-turn-helix transcriptional regulator [Oscillospiraceae bacterium]|nr:helix-turn-helix transcriptional regulator [Oscillospiraceae bacterium]
MDLPNKFRTLRTQKDISVYKLSKDTDISQNYIRKIEKGESQPSVLVMEKLLTRLGTTLAEFYNESGDVLYPTDDERTLIESFRILNEEKAAALLHLAKLMAK